MSTASDFNLTKVIAGSERDGWRLGYVGSPWPGPWPKLSGALFVTDPSGLPAGLAWESTGPSIEQLVEPSRARWGVFRVRFPIPVMSEQDLVANFHLVLLLLQAERAKIHSR